MFSTNAITYSRRDFLIVATWWGLVAGLGEGLTWFHEHSPVWHDLIRAALIVNGLLFLGVGLVIVILNPRLSVTRGLLVRATMGFSLLAFYDWSGRLVPRLFNLLPFLIALAAVAIAALIFYFCGEQAMRFQKRSLPALAAVAVWCVLMFPVQHHRDESRNLARLAPATPGAPNVLVILVDTLGADHLSTYGYSRPTSPNLTRVANQGVTFDNAVSASSWTLPAHASILTGLYPHDHHVEGYTSNLGGGYPTLGEALEARGYRTAAFSANTGVFSRQRGFGRGFIHFEDDFESWGSTFGQTYYGSKIESRLCQMHFTRDLWGRLSAADINRHALHWIDSDRRPFFVFLNFYDLHDPYLPPNPFLHQYTKVKNPGGWFTAHWEWFDNLTQEQRLAAHDAYDGAVNYVDVKMGDLMQELERRGLDGNTLVIITSDHGEGFYEHGLMNHGNSLYREVIHVPLILREPGQIPAGRRIADPVSLTALPATVLDLLGDGGQKRFREASWKALWTQAERQDTIAAPISELAQMSWNPRFPNYYGPMQSITTSEWHYITGGNRGEQLFRCCGAVPESSNLATTDEGKKVCQQFREELQLLTKTGFEEWAAQAGLNAKHLHRVSQH